MWIIQIVRQQTRKGKYMKNYLDAFGDLSKTEETILYVFSLIVCVSIMFSIF